VQDRDVCTFDRSGFGKCSTSDTYLEGCGAVDNQFHCDNFTWAPQFWVGGACGLSDRKTVVDCYGGSAPIRYVSYVTYRYLSCRLLVGRRRVESWAVTCRYISLLVIMLRWVGVGLSHGRGDSEQTSRA